MKRTTPRENRVVNRRARNSARCCPLGVVMTEPVGALLALKLTHTPFSVSSVLGLLALMGVSVETAVILASWEARRSSPVPACPSKPSSRTLRPGTRLMLSTFPL